MDKPAQTPLVSFRFPQETLDQLDLVAKRLSQPGNPMTRTGAVRYLIALGLQKDQELQYERKRISTEKRLSPKQEATLSGRVNVPEENKK